MSSSAKPTPGIPGPNTEIRSLASNKRPSLTYYALAGIFAAGALYFLSVRLVEIIDSSFLQPFHFPILVVVYLAIMSLFITPPKTMALAARRFGLIFIVLLYLKSELDSKLFEGAPVRDLTEHVAIVTGGNSGIGFATVKHLVGLNGTVVMACRTLNKCQDSVKEIASIYPQRADHVIPLQLDLSDLESISNFVTVFKQRFHRLDILVNNAGLICPSGPRTKQGFEELLGSMHIGHYALTKWLLDLLSRPIPGQDNVMDAARIVNVASEAFIVGNFHPSIFTESGAGDFYGEVTDNCPKLYGFWPCCPMNACPYTNGYARAKLANILHLQELQRRYDEFIYDYRQQHPELLLLPLHEQEQALPFRRIVTATLHPGSVSSNIAALLKYSFSLIRSIDESGWIILDAILNNEFVPSSFLDTMKGKHDLISYRKYGLEKHVDNFPSLKDKTKIFSSHYRQKINHFSLHTYAWENTNFIQPEILVELKNKSKREIVHLLKIRLWDVTESIVLNWEKTKDATKLLGNKVTETVFTLPALHREVSVKIDESGEESHLILKEELHEVNPLKTGEVITEVLHTATVINSSRLEGQAEHIPSTNTSDQFEGSVPELAVEVEGHESAEVINIVEEPLTESDEIQVDAINNANIHNQVEEGVPETIPLSTNEDEENHKAAKDKNDPASADRKEEVLAEGPFQKATEDNSKPESVDGKEVEKEDLPHENVDGMEAQEAVTKLSQPSSVLTPERLEIQIERTSNTNRLDQTEKFDESVEGTFAETKGDQNHDDEIDVESVDGKEKLQKKGLPHETISKEEVENESTGEAQNQPHQELIPKEEFQAESITDQSELVPEVSPAME